MTVPEAIQVAKDHLVTVLPEFSEDGLQLEELETPPHGSKWRFTFSMTLPQTTGTSSLVQALRGRRVSKSIEIDSEDGALLAVKNAAV